MILKVKKINKDAVVPKYACEDDAGMDLFSVQDLEITPMQRVQIETGIAIQIPSGFVGLIWDKSGLSHNYGLKVLGGVIDSGYRGEIKVGIINLSNENFILEKGQKIAQMIIQKKENCNIEIVTELEDSERGDLGFGSSGK